MARRVMLMNEKPDRPRYEEGFERAIHDRFDVTASQPVDLASWRTDDLGEFDAVFVFRRFAELEQADPIDWHGYGGRRVMVDFDSFHDFTTWSDRPGRWRETFARHRFDVLVCSGVRSHEHFTGHGIESILVHKGFDPALFHELGRERSGMCFFGTPYRSRGALLRHLEGAHLPVDRRRCAYTELNDVLNDYLAMVTTVLGATVRFGRLGRGIERLRAGTVLRYEPAAEPMAKHFEAAAAGCAVITDHTPDLELLGFVDGESVVAFSDFDEMVERVRHYLARPDDLRSIGAAGAELCRRRHTWDHRVEALDRALFA